MLVIDDNSSKVNLEEGLQDIVSKVGVIEKDVRVVNLMDYCSKKEDIKKVDNISQKKQDIEIPCYECDK